MTTSEQAAGGGRPSGDQADISILLDEGRRSFDRTLAIRKAGDDRAQGLLQLSIAVLGGGVILESFVFGFDLFSERAIGFLIGWVLLALVFNIAAAILLVQAHTGFTSRSIASGPTPDQIHELQGRKRARELTVSQAALQIYQDEMQHEISRNDEEARLRRRGIWSLVLAVGLYLAGPAGALLLSLAGL